MRSGWLLALLLPTAALAQAEQCRIPDTLPRPTVERADPRIVPIGGYALALSWSPEYCRFRQDSPRDAIQCSGANGRFGFVLHGLWPEGRGKTWPQYCRAAGVLPDQLIRQHLCATPSPQLLQHEWAKHGTCMSAQPGGYLAASALLFGAVRYPDMAALSRQDLTAGRFARAFAAANRGMSPDMLRVIVNRRGWLEEVRICLRLDMKLAACPEHAAGAAADVPVRIWRGR